MPVLPYEARRFCDRQELYQFLFACKQIAVEKDRSQLVSISLESEDIDPLAVLQTLSKPQQLHFYIEKVEQPGSPLTLLEPFPTQEDVSNSAIGSYAIAALDTAIYLKTEGPQRFELSQEFIQSSLADAILAGNLDVPFAGPHFYCSFTFFDTNYATRTDKWGVLPEAATPTLQPPLSLSPFPAATIFLPRWQIAHQDQRTGIVGNFMISPDSPLQSLCERIWQGFQTIQTIQQHSVLCSHPHPLSCFSKQDVVEPSQFRSAVDSALSAIQANYLHKIVLSHALDVTAPTPIDGFRSLNTLRCLNPNCYIFSTSNGQGQTFLGASPERLLRLSNSQLLTDALAGSAPRGKTALEDAQFASHLLASAKELHEHRVVIDFIQRQLFQLGLQPQLSITQPCLLQLPNIQHLRTPIQARVPTHVHLLEILADLHPTPAVAGTPRDVACQEIRRYESFERGLFAAPLGWVDYQGNGEFIVGIRSALIDGLQARLYAGAGIVAGSDPDQEFAEINLKLQALLKALS
jgi:menaquinone-specific isochorismate synthase